MFFLGIEVALSDLGIHINQRKHALNLVCEAGLSAFKPSDLSMETYHKLALS